MAYREGLRPAVCRRVLELISSWRVQPCCLVPGLDNHHARTRRINQFNTDLWLRSQSYFRDQYRPANRVRRRYAVASSQGPPRLRRLRVSALPHRDVMPHAVTSSTPALWPLSSDERMSIEFAIKACQEKNRVLEKLVARLSEIISKDVH